MDNSLRELCAIFVNLVVKTLMKEEKFNMWYVVVIGALVLEVILFYVFTTYFS
jgi:hypothetical protein